MTIRVFNGGRPLSDPTFFTAHGFELVEQSVNARTSKEEYIELLKDVDGAMVGTLPLTDAEVLRSCPKLKVLSRSGVGVDSIDLGTATELGILACNTPGVNTTEVADHAMGLLLALTRLIREFDGEVKSGNWSSDPALVRERVSDLRRIAGSTVGIVGFGNIGKAFATRVRGFGPFKILAYDPYIAQTTADLFGVQLVEFKELLTESDFISVHAPSTTESNHLFNSEAFRTMKSSSILVNTARGPIVDGNALYEALVNSEISAAALDVTEVEPIDAQDPLLNLDNLIITPHIATGSPVSAREMSRKQAENVSRVLTGIAPHGIANPEAIKTIAIMRQNDDVRWEGIPDFSTALAL